MSMARWCSATSLSKRFSQKRCFDEGRKDQPDTDSTRPRTCLAPHMETKRENYLFIVEGIDTTHTTMKKGARIRGVFALVKNKATYKATGEATESLQVFRKVGDIDLPSGHRRNAFVRCPTTSDSTGPI